MKCTGIGVPTQIADRKSQRCVATKRAAAKTWRNAYPLLEQVQTPFVGPPRTLSDRRPWSLPSLRGYRHAVLQFWGLAPSAGRLVSTHGQTHNRWRASQRLLLQATTHAHERLRCFRGSGRHACWLSVADLTLLFLARSHAMQPDTPPVGQPVAIHPLHAQDARKAEVTTALPLHIHTCLVLLRVQNRSLRSIPWPIASLILPRPFPCLSAWPLTSD